MSTPTIHPDHLSYGERLARDVAAWKAAGNHVQVLAPGVCNWDQLSNRQKINPTVTAENRQAQKVIEGKTLSQYHPKAKPEPKAPKVKPERAPRAGHVHLPQSGHGPRLAPAGSQKARILDHLKGSSGTPISAQAIADALSINRKVVQQQLAVLRELGAVESSGKRRSMVWALSPTPAKLAGRPSPKTDAIVALLTGKPPMRGRDIGKALGYTGSALRQRLWQMKESGQLLSHGCKGTMKWSLKASA